MDGAGECGIGLDETTDFASRTGKGASETVAGRAVALGNKAMLAELAVDTGSLDFQADGFRSESPGAMFVANVQKLAGLLQPSASPSPAY